MTPSAWPSSPQLVLPFAHSSSKLGDWYRT
jgi:hypothetical protein